MHVYFVVEEPQDINQGGDAFGRVATKASIVMSQTDTAVADIADQKVIFAVRSEDEDKCQAISRAIVDVYNIWIKGVEGHQAANGNEIRSHGSWTPNADEAPPAGAEFVYVYATPFAPNVLNLKNIFYIGRGINERWLDHVHDAHRYLANHIAKDPLDVLKFQKIIEALTHGGAINLPPKGKKEWVRKNLARRIAHFYGDYANLKSEAVECFLISYWIGVFDLTNKNRGHSDFKDDDFEWITYPRAILETEPWSNLVRRFSEGNDVTQGPANQLLVQEINSVFARGEWNWNPVVITNNADPTIQLIPSQQVFITNNTDVYFEFKLRILGRDYLTLHLKNETSGTGVRINIRRLSKSESLVSFTEKIRRTFFSGNIEDEWDADTYIKVPYGDSYFKPCANLGNGRQDVYFDLRNLANASLIKSGAPLMQGGGQNSFTLDEALQTIVDLVHAA